MSGLTERVARALYESEVSTALVLMVRDEAPPPWDDLIDPWRAGWFDAARAVLGAVADDVDGLAGVLAEVLWRRMSDPLERRAFPFDEAPSRMTYLAHGKAQAEQLAAHIRDGA